MSKGVVFNNTSYELTNLISEVDSGTIALPDLQRPFVWKDTQIRDLIDSLYKGLPAGLIILWKVGEGSEFKPIGFDKSTTPSRLVIDGQQRLTSLFTIFTGKEVLDKNYKSRLPRIGFNPLTEEIDVINSSKEKDVEWINNITEILLDKRNVRKTYIKSLKEKKPDLNIDEDLIEDNIDRIADIKHYPFSVLELSSDLDPEEVSEIFVRINSKGKVLNQSDFILTLLSIYYDEGRTALEEFSKGCKNPSVDGEVTSYNTIYAFPEPEHLIRSAVAYAFYRGRLKYAYLILKGRNFENRTTTKELRDTNLEIFKEALNDVLNLVYWQDYTNLINSIGFINYKELISSQVGFYVTYAFYLIGKIKFKVDIYKLNRIISKWFVFSQLTQRYSGSPESIIEQDLISIKNSQDFIEVLTNIMNNELTNDYWNITLPQRNMVSSRYNYAFKVYNASLIYKDDNILFSHNKLREQLRPDIKTPKKSIDKHHIFPQNYLKKQGLDQTQYNQQANMIYIEYRDNIRISDKAPYDYWPMMLDLLNENERKEIEENYQEAYDLPYEFWNMEYNEFLTERRKLIAKSIRKYFEIL